MREQTSNESDSSGLKSSTVFKDLSNLSELINYLSNSEARLDNSKFVYHYTGINTALNILSSRKWHLGNAKYSNDLLEYENGDLKLWPHLFLGSFMAESSESIGMWSMYSQPWEQGVKIAISSLALRHWVQKISVLHEVDLDSKALSGRTVPRGDAEISLASVVYCNTDSRNDSYSVEKITWSNQSNTNFFDAAHIKQLTGYVKDDAWSYEKEIRIRVKLSDDCDFKRLAVDIPDEVFDSMVIYKSPKFSGDIDQLLVSSGCVSVRTKDSIFTGKLSLKSLCEECSYKSKLQISEG